MRIIRCTILFTLLLCLLCLAGTPSYALDIENIRFGEHKNKTRLVVDISDVTDFRAFTLSSPYRMVIDLPEFSWNAKNITRPPAARISDIRQGGLTHGISRIVFDLEQPIVIESAFLLPKQGKKQNRIVIDYKPTGTSAFKKAQSTIHGTLKIPNHAKNPNQELKAKASKGIPIPPPNSARPKKNPSHKPLIIIDPGHGGVDPGAVGHGKIYEKHVVLALAKSLRDELVKTGKYRVLLTRETDRFIRLKDRVKFARSKGGDLFVSLHADSIHKPNVRGTSIYTLSKKSSDKQTAKLAEKENRADLIANVDVDIEDEQVAFILGDFLMNDTMNQSKFFANKLVRSLKNHGIKTLENPHRYAGFAVLKAPDIPSILIEAGFMSNKAEARLLNQSSHRKKLAKSIKAGINTYFDYVHKNEKN